MSWYEPWTWDLSTDADRTNQQRGQLLNQQGAAAAQFGNQAAGSYFGSGYPLQNAINNLTDLANGKNSISAEQLRQGMQQGISAQQSMAASASPQDAAMAARTAMNNMGRLGYGLSGQQALAGLQERQMANQALGQFALGMRGQDLQGFLGANSNAMNAYGAQAPQSAATQMLNSGIGGAAAFLASRYGQPDPGTKSDRRAKKGVADGDKAANAATSKLTAHTFAYKDPKDGKGKQLGVMAQDLQKHGLGHAVIETPQGKMVHGGKLATANTAMIAALGRRVAELEKGKSKGGRKAAGY